MSLLTDIVIAEALMYTVKLLPPLLQRAVYGKEEFYNSHNHLGFPAGYWMRRMLLPTPFEFLHVFYDCLRIESLAKKQNIKTQMCDPITDELFMEQMRKFY